MSPRHSLVKSRFFVSITIIDDRCCGGTKPPCFLLTSSIFRWDIVGNHCQKQKYEDSGRDVH